MNADATATAIFECGTSLYSVLLLGGSDRHSDGARPDDLVVSCTCTVAICSCFCSKDPGALGLPYRTVCGIRRDRSGVPGVEPRDLSRPVGRSAKF